MIARPPLVTRQGQRKAFAARGASPEATAARPKFIAYSRLAATPASSNDLPRMTPLAVLGLLHVLMGAAAEQPAQAESVRRVVIRDELILRIPVRPRRSVPIAWQEKKGPRCLDASHIAGAMLSGASSIDFVMKDRTRFRAEMDSECPALDFYGGFYLQLDDERICARRETIRSRVGGSCRIERFRKLIPKGRTQAAR
jgi:hypothetical protein